MILSGHGEPFLEGDNDLTGVFQRQRVCGIMSRKANYLIRYALLEPFCAGMLFVNLLEIYLNTLAMEATTTMISVSELEKLLFSISKHEHQICIRYRTIGQLWHPNFLRILKIEDGKRVLFHDETRKQLVQLHDFYTIAQFELDSRLYPYEPNCHYHIFEEGHHHNQ